LFLERESGISLSSSTEGDFVVFRVFFFLFLFVCMVVSLIFGNGGCWFGGREEEAAGGGEQDEAENEDRFAVGDFGEDLCRFMFFLFNNLF